MVYFSCLLLLTYCHYSVQHPCFPRSSHLPVSTDFLCVFPAFPLMTPPMGWLGSQPNPLQFVSHTVPHHCDIARPIFFVCKVFEE